MKKNFFKLCILLFMLHFGFGLTCYEIFAQEQQSTATIQFLNPSFEKVDVTLTLLDQQTHQPLANAIFGLREGTSHFLLTNLRSNQAGQIYLTHLPFGEYDFIEIKSPPGYALDTSFIPFTISPSHPQISLIVYNHLLAKKNPNVYLPKVGFIANKALFYIGISFVILGLFVIITYLRKKRRYNEK